MPDILFVIVAVLLTFVLIVTGAVTVILFTENSDWQIPAKITSALLAITVICWSWFYLACVDSIPVPKHTYHEFEWLHNIPFYIDETGRPNEIYGDAKFADPKTTHYQITNTPGHWRYGIYFTGSRTVKLVCKDSVEK